MRTWGWRSVLQGVILGVAIVLPGLSGGTAAVVMGIYRELVEDISTFNWRPHLALGTGVVAGVLGGARVTEYLLLNFPGILSSYLLGVILASAWLVFRHNLPLRPGGVFAWLTGVGIGLAVAAEPLGAVGGHGQASPLAVFLGGSVASAAMMLPGMSGGTMLVMMGLYDDMLSALNRLDLPMIAIFGLGCVLGVIVITRILSGIMGRFPVATSLLLGGMIMGSAKAVWAGFEGMPKMAAFLVGLATVILASRR